MCFALLGTSMNLLAQKMPSVEIKAQDVFNKTIMQSELGQYMTPKQIAVFMASLFDNSASEEIRLLDAGAGSGSLTLAFLEHFLKANILNVFDVHAWEIDPLMVDQLTIKLINYKDSVKKEEKNNLFINIHLSDFINDSVSILKLSDHKKFTHAILNPPYKKIKNDSKHKLLLHQVGIETVNYYSAFLALSIKLMEDKGQIVAIIPRSFCNGPYYKSFRKLILNSCAIKQIHLFESRKNLFKGDNVLQENVIIYLEKNGIQGSVQVSKSFDANFDDYECETYSFNSIIKEENSEFFIHIPIKSVVSLLLPMYSLAKLNIQLSTGKVVDFRVKEFWSQSYDKDLVPLIYPHHFTNGIFEYPKVHKKPNALILNDVIKKMVMPSGYYVLVKRLSSKEERRRVVAYVFNPTLLNASYFAFENHWNVFHVNNQGLEKYVAYGLASFLNSTFFEDCFRGFSGLTQVNATDLRMMKYPSIAKLSELGKKTYNKRLSQVEIDEYVQSINH